MKFEILIFWNLKFWNLTFDLWRHFFALLRESSSLCSWAASSGIRRTPPILLYFLKFKFLKFEILKFDLWPVTSYFLLCSESRARFASTRQIRLLLYYYGLCYKIFNCGTARNEMTRSRHETHSVLAEKSETLNITTVQKCKKKNSSNN